MKLQLLALGLGSLLLCASARSVARERRSAALFELFPSRLGGSRVHSMKDFLDSRKVAGHRYSDATRLSRLLYVAGFPDPPMPGK